MVSRNLGVVCNKLGSFHVRILAKYSSMHAKPISLARYPFGRPNR